MEKVCISCKLPKDISLFHKRSSEEDGLHCYCKSCIKEKNKVSAERIRKGIPPRVKKTCEERREYYRLWQKDRKESDPLFKFDRSIRKLIYMSLDRQGHRKVSKTSTILGC